MADDEKKIIVDDDWKNEAKKEKQQLKEQESAGEQEPGEQERPPLPPANFPGLVSMLATQVFFALGLIGTEETKDRKPDLEIAKFNIDMLALIEEKTKGNLDENEAKMLTDTLQQLRMAFVSISKQE